jgi:hypothetical protein
MEWIHAFERYKILGMYEMNSSTYVWPEIGNGQWIWVA